VRKAKEKLRSIINDEHMDDAWAWTCKCIQQYPGALCYRDKDKDSLLHIVTLHMDVAKIYALVEQMLKLELEFNDKPFDMPNAANETPLFLAVEKRNALVVDYLLEAGAFPNMHNSRPERDAPLHYAATRGITDVVKVLCSYPQTDLNLTNGMSLTPLLCAVKSHGVLEEESESIVNNKPTVEILLKYGADPSIADSTNGKTVIHYAVEQLDTELIEIFRSNLSDEVMAALIDKTDSSGDTPMDVLKTMQFGDEQLRSKLGLALITCGASTA